MKFEEKILPIEEIVKERQSGTSLLKIADKYNVTVKVIQNMIDEYCEKNNVNVTRYDKIKLSIDKIVAQRNSGISIDEIALEYNAYPKNISDFIEEYYNKQGKTVPKILKHTGIIKDYLKKGIQIDEIKKIAKESNIIITDELIEKVKREIAEENELQETEER